MLACLMATFLVEVQAVLKEKDLNQTLVVLRNELIERHHELTGSANDRRQQNDGIRKEIMETWSRSNQNSLMLYSQKSNYVFDLTYACNEATKQYHDFQKRQLPFKTFLESNDKEIAKYDSLIGSLRSMPSSLLTRRAKTDRNICLTLAVNIRNTLIDNQSQITENIKMYEMTEVRLKYMNDYAQLRYNEIQTGIFMNGGKNYFMILKDFRTQMSDVHQTLLEKYKPSEDSQWNSKVILFLFVIIIVYIIIASLLNLLAIRVLLPRRFRTEEFLKKRSCVIMATTTITFALILALVRNIGSQNFIIMASNLLIEFAWLLAVVLISLLLRVNGDQIKSAFRIYAPLLAVGFLVIAFRIVLIPNELVNMIFPPLLLIATLWQWNVIGRHNQNIPKQDMFYTYISLLVFIVSLVCSWMGYTLLAVQILIWWVMQLTCILTITCIYRWLTNYGIRKNMAEKPITKTWHFRFLHKVVLPIMGVLSVMISIYWAADVFNLSEICWKIFRMNFLNPDQDMTVESDEMQISIVKLSMVICLWFTFSYIASTLLDFMRHRFMEQDPSSADSRTAMSRNVVQVFIWGVWLLMSLSILHISLTWLLAISGGLSTGIGFASKNIIENIFYGASLMTGRLKVGDRIEVDGTMGTVQQISYTSTVVESIFGEVITYQNSQLFDKNYKNLTRNHGYVLAIVPFGVAYGSNLKQVQEVVEEAANKQKNPWTDPAKPITTVIAGMNDSSIDFKLMVWVDASKKARVISDMLQCIYDTLGEHGIEIPFPQRDITIKNAADFAVGKK